METLVSVFIGVGLSAACGFRVFVPLLIMSAASLGGLLELNSSFEWIGTYYAFGAFLVATLLEVSTYFIPWLDHLLDLVATPAAIVAGIVVTASVVVGMSPLLTWATAIVAGGGTAAAFQGSTVLARGASSVTTGGVGNPVVSTGELCRLGRDPHGCDSYAPGRRDHRWNSLFLSYQTPLKEKRTA